MNRRNFLRLGIGAAIAAPALVSRANIMAIKVPRPDTWLSDVLFPPDDRLWGVSSIEASGLQLLQNEYNRLLRIALDPADKSDHAAVSRYERQGGHVIIRDVRIIESPNLVASNYGRGPGLLTADASGRRKWTPWA